MKLKIVSVISAGLLGTLIALPANADILWNWSFAGESGTFLTNGTAVGQVATPGTYLFKDFTAGLSAVGEPVGSVTGGQYVASGFFDTSTPYSFVWSGSAVTEWDKTGLNDFIWWVFNNAGLDFYFFGSTVLNENDPTQAVVFRDGVYLTHGTINVAPAVPEPSTWAMLLIGFAGIGFAACRRKQLLARSATATKKRTRFIALSHPRFALRRRWNRSPSENSPLCCATHTA
jgi:hypothetical protein